jgi:hypothetical protein
LSCTNESTAAGVNAATADEVAGIKITELAPRSLKPPAPLIHIQ